MTQEFSHILRHYYGEVVERGNVEKLSEFFGAKYVAHFPGKNLELQELKNFLQTIHKYLKNISVEIENDKLEGDVLTHEILFQANRKVDMFPVEWRSISKWKLENGKVIESWPNTTIPFRVIIDIMTKGEKVEKIELSQKAPTKIEQGEPAPSKTEPATAAE